jgi:hypothetical protein
MEKFFNNAGPQRASRSYTLDPLRRIKFEQLDGLIQQERYFVLHAPRQTGKTTALYAMMHHYNAGETFRALYVNIETAQVARNNVNEGISSVCHALAEAAKLHLGDGSLMPLLLAHTVDGLWRDALTQLIAHLSANDPRSAELGRVRPLILMVDEIDALIGDTLISVLRQIRAGYSNRPAAFAQTVILCGIRDVRDYRIHSAASQEIITGGSAFNIKADSLVLSNFSQAEVNELYDQHTAATGQIFTTEARELAWRYTHGQPWLVNALAYDCTYRMEAMRDRSIPITGETLRLAKERMVLARETHLDQLIDKLKEPRVKRVISPLLENEDYSDFQDDDLQYCLDLGLVRQGDANGTRTLVIANDIYREVIPRELTYLAQVSFANSSIERHNAPQAWYFKTDADGQTCLDIPKLLTTFQQFYRENSEHWLAGMVYREAAPQLLLQAYLQRIVNGGGRIEREYGLGRGRTDLYVTWPASAQATQHVVIEIKVKRVKDGMDAVVARGQAQTLDYMQHCGATEGHLVVFNPDPALNWDTRVYNRPLTDGVTLWGC